MSDEILVTLHVNGQRRALALEPSLTLVEVLRDHLELTGTKEGCGQGDCGACTVLVDGRAVNSCLTLAVECDGSEITTIEGLAADGDLHPLQKSFVKHGALQCGYCTPGMLMATKALIDRVPDPSDDEIKEALSGNLCRCAAYPRIIRAIREREDFADVPLDTKPPLDDERDQERDLTVVSHSVTRYLSDPSKVQRRCISRRPPV